MGVTGSCSEADKVSMCGLPVGSVINDTYDFISKHVKKREFLGQKHSQSVINVFAVLPLLFSDAAVGVRLENKER